MDKVIGYLKGFEFFKVVHSNFEPIPGHWNIVSVHPTWSVTWHWLISWTAPWTPKKWRGMWKNHWWSLGFSFSSQKLMPRDNRG